MIGERSEDVELRMETASGGVSEADGFF